MTSDIDAKHVCYYLQNIIESNDTNTREEMDFSWNYFNCTKDLVCDYKPELEKNFTPPQLCSGERRRKREVTKQEDFPNIVDFDTNARFLQLYMSLPDHLRVVIGHR